MPKRDDAPNGAPCWIDLFTSNPDASRTFYETLFGWKAEEPNPEFGGYFNFTFEGVPVAGGMRNDGSAGAPDGWNVHLATTDAQATIDATLAHGGSVDFGVDDVGELGRMAMITDPGGAHVGVWQPKLHRGLGIVAEPGAPAWFELHTRAYDAVVAFYRDVFHWPTHTVGDAPGFRYTTYGEGEAQLAGIMDASDFLPDGVPSHWSIYFGTSDVDATLGRITELGGAVVDPAQDTPYGRLATATDPTGARFKLRG